MIARLAPELHEARRIVAAFAPAIGRRAAREMIEASVTALFLAGLFAAALGLAV